MAQKTPDVALPSPGARWVPGVWNPSSQARGLWLTKPQTRVSGLGISSLALPLCKMWRVVVPNFLLSQGVQWRLRACEMTCIVLRTGPVHHGMNTLRPGLVSLGSRQGCGSSRHHVPLEAVCGQLQGSEDTQVWSQETSSPSGPGTNFVSKSLKLSALVSSSMKRGDES